MRALGWIVAVAVSLGAIYASGDAIDAGVSSAERNYDTMPLEPVDAHL